MTITLIPLLFGGALSAFLLGYSVGTGHIMRAIFPSWIERMRDLHGAAYWQEQKRYNLVWNAAVDAQWTMYPIRRHLRLDNELIPEQFR